MNRVNQALLVGALSVAFCYSAQAKEASSEACQSFADKPTVLREQDCKNYITGFIEGALLTDAAIIESLSSERSDFLERVYETRALRTRDKIPATYFAKFCLAEPLDLPAVIGTVLNHLKTSYAKDQRPATNVYNAFKTHFPCDNR